MSLFPFPQRKFGRSFRNLIFQSFLWVIVGQVPITSEALPYPGRSPDNKLNASDAADGDQFATSVATSDDFIVIGAIFEDGAGIASDNFGAVYVYDADTGEELMKLQASDPGVGDRFGQSVAISGNRLVVGALFEDGAGLSSDNFGAAYVFDLTTGEELFKLQASDPGVGDRFGVSVGISGNFVVVGSQFQDGGGASNAQRGAAYFFDLDQPVVPNSMFPGMIRENVKIVSSDLQDGDQFGYSVAVSGSLAIVGALNEDGTGGNGAERGAAYVFRLPSGEQSRKLTPNDPGDDDRFGHSVAIDGDLALVGAAGEDGSGVDRGAAYLFNLGTGNQVHKFTATDAENADGFGTSVSVSGETALVGAPFEDGDGTGDCRRGALYAFDTVTGVEMVKWVAADTGDGDELGISVSSTGRLIVGGAHLEEGAGSNRGAAYVFHTPRYQPDGRIGRRPLIGVGGDLYNLNASGQTLLLESRNLRQVKAWVTVSNDGNRVDDYGIVGSPGKPFFAVRYFQSAGVAQLNVTAAVTSGVHELLSVLPGETGRVLSVELTPSRKLLKRKQGRRFIQRKDYRGGVTISSRTLSDHADRVGVIVKTR